ncbi:MAG: hypothetical protein KUA36_13715 [Desulfomicrobium sp.]|nr:hypothetical protein [Pseudomonadota bacterium]MBV1749197.1 hypothetical protein [Desulfomicrobium sp.]
MKQKNHEKQFPVPATTRDMPGGADKWRKPLLANDDATPSFIAAPGNETTS